MHTVKKHNRRTTFISLICVLSNISYYPILVANGLGRIIAIGVWLIFALSLIGKLGWATLNSKYRTFILLYFIFVVNSAITSVFNGVNAYGNHFFVPVTIATIVFTLANILGFELDKEDVTKFCTVYYYICAIMAILLFIFYLRGTDLVTSVYGYQYGKNEIAVLLLCAMIISCTIYKPSTRLLSIVRIVAIVFFVMDIILLRTRSVLFGIGLLAIIIVFNKKEIRKSFRAFILLVIIGVIIYFVRNPLSFDAFIKNIVFAGRNANSLNDISSGRGDQIKLAFSAFADNLVFGVGVRFTCDCFYISALANYGLLCWPIVIMALMPVIWSVKHYDNSDGLSICFFIMTISIFEISLLEELAPFGPGTRCYILWLIWGIMISQNRYCNEVME